MYSMHGLLKIWQHRMIEKKYLPEITKNQRMSLHEIRELQYKKLKDLLEHACRNVPYYTNLFNCFSLKPNDIKSLDDLPKIPTLTKEDVIKNYSDIIAINAKEYAPLKLSSGGTTGTSLNFYMDKEAYHIRETENIHYYISKMYPYDKAKTIFLRADVLIPKGSPLKKPWRYDFVRKWYVFSGYYLSESVMNDYYLIMKKFKPDYLIGLPSPSYILAKYMNEKNLTINMKKIFTSSEMLFPSYREEIEKAFNSKIYDIYGHGEPGSWARQCEYGHYHIDTNSYFETNEDGRTIETSLTNYSMPFVRYDIGDKIDGIYYDCECGLKTPYFKEIQGRISDNIITPDGRCCIGIGFDQVFKGTNILQGQIIQNEIPRIDVNIIPQKNYSPEYEKKLLMKLRDRLGDQIKINLNIVDDIPHTKSGKYKLVVSNILDRKKD